MAAPLLLITPGWNKTRLVMQPQQRIQGSPLRALANASCPTLPRHADVSRRGRKRGDSWNRTLGTENSRILHSFPAAGSGGAFSWTWEGAGEKRIKDAVAHHSGKKAKAASGACRCVALGLQSCQIPHVKKPPLSYQNLDRVLQAVARKDSEGATTQPQPQPRGFFLLQQLQPFTGNTKPSGCTQHRYRTSNGTFREEEEGEPQGPGCTPV